MIGSHLVFVAKKRKSLYKKRTQTCSHNKLDHKSFLKGKTEHVELHDQQTNKQKLLVLLVSLDPQIASPCHYSTSHHVTIHRRGASRQKKNSFADSWIRSLEPRRWKKEREPCGLGFLSVKMVEYGSHT